MGTSTKIEWTDATWNPIRGCSRVSEGCRNCYAEAIAARFNKSVEELPDRIGVQSQAYNGLAVMTESGPRWTGEVRFIEELLTAPLHWRKPRRVFVNSMSDLFHEKVQDEWIDRIFAVMALCPQHTFQVLTKRPERMLAILAKGIPRGADLRRGVQDVLTDIDVDPRKPLDKIISAMPDHWPLRNVWLGVSVEDQKTADERIPLLLQTPAAVRWVSYEPALGPVRFGKSSMTGNGNHRPLVGDAVLDWIVAGGESGPGARQSHPDWFRSARDQCQAAGVPFFFKQWGEWRPAPPNDTPSYRVGKKKAGRQLDGREWNEYPA